MSFLATLPSSRTFMFELQTARLDLGWEEGQTM
jgi:hypothetical protein